MRKNKVILIGNLKQNPKTLKEALTLSEFYIKLKKTYKNLELGISLPYVFLHEVNKKYSKSLNIYAQNISAYPDGAHTGEVGAIQIKSLKIKGSIIGHSETRANGDTNETIQKKVTEALKNNLQIILCVGEKERKDNGDYVNEINTQIESALLYVKKAETKNITIVYEPVWAIGEKAVRNANQDEIYEITIIIRKKLFEMFGKSVGEKINIMYGGSVNSKNINSLSEIKPVNGFLLGRTSLDTKELKLIAETLNNI